MKTLICIFVVSFSILSCANSNRDNVVTNGTSSSHEKILSKNATSGISINTTLPFGCIDLSTIKYPKEWPGHETGLMQPQRKEFENIAAYFQKINASKTIGHLKINELKILKIGSIANDAYFDTLAIKYVDSCIYRLPNIGIYECYYFYQN